MIFIEKVEGHCLNCVKKFLKVNKFSIITPFNRDDRDFELCDDCARTLGDMIRDNEDWED